MNLARVEDLANSESFKKGTMEKTLRPYLEVLYSMISTAEKKNLARFSQSLLSFSLQLTQLYE